MSNEFELNATVRTVQGKGASRRLRRLNDEIPAILYGAGKDPVSLTIAHKDLAKAIENEAFFSHIITLNVGKKKEKAVIKALQRHPARPFLMHADFQRVSATQALHVKVPLHFLNEDTCEGVKVGGGSIIKALTDIEVSCLPKNLPEFIEVDMLEVKLGETLHISDITLPKGVTSIALSHGEDSDHSVVTVIAPKSAEEETEVAAPAADAASEEGESED
ncbi:MAG: 50S ribosomal protein L25/general stress protein Ctc [SAR86 cluster bacterium]|uniref:Large ribosomal subunit protein bL25 n=1 Tax=SAR86 cluster bacterium TaxID=2030880 RepID=A0A2A4MWB0_9GAMM|nr:MAG: 50S ribosomal protein L25/general stress protein Ctc [SAR86 cluster bacterium]